MSGSIQVVERIEEYKGYQVIREFDVMFDNDTKPSDSISYCFVTWLKRPDKSDLNVWPIGEDIDLEVVTGDNARESIMNLIDVKFEEIKKVIDNDIKTQVVIEELMKNGFTIQ